MGRSRSRSPRRERRRSGSRERRRSGSRERDRRRRSRDRRRSRSPKPRRRSPPRRARSSSSSPVRPAKSEARPPKPAKKELTEEDLEGRTEEEIEMIKIMGFAEFDSTKGRKVEGSVNAYAINVSQKRKYRQYMNRKGGFNRPLDFVA
ncbi:hypothetical protein NDU88_000348 [Pleurodeles waltl]|uniref:U4/U6.U5 small nuclear ribonucleoprotein 27 kDa protein n=1 Tax=Pleurodeles waltl TaxID=8319 RepID=A0AAV7V576_PLEWA|nr:hypothetical protein NDU88_000348 [Pleurodeles waltl]